MWEQENKKLILASSSPRRQSILKLMGLKFDIIKPDGIKEIDTGDPYRAVEVNSEIKAEKVKQNIDSQNCVICGFDTIVYFEKEFFGKPVHRSQASEWLHKLSGRAHLVITGVCLIDKVSGQKKIGSETTRVQFRQLGPEEIESYLQQEEVGDKAGAYNIGGRGALLVKRIEGCFYNVMGLPVARFIEMAKEINYNIFDER